MATTVPIPDPDPDTASAAYAYTFCALVVADLAAEARATSARDMPVLVRVERLEDLARAMYQRAAEAAGT